MGKYTHRGYEYFVDGPNKNGKWNWRVSIGSVKYVGDAQDRSGAKDAARSIINRKS